MFGETAMTSRETIERSEIHSGQLLTQDTRYDGAMSEHPVTDDDGRVGMRSS